MGAVRTFYRCQNFEFSPDFYSIDCVSSPWLQTVRMTNVGNTSLWLSYVTTCRRTGKELVRNTNQLVRIDTTTRRPAQLPAERVAFFKTSANGSMMIPPRFDFPMSGPDPSKVFKFTKMSLPSETDANIHVNQSVCFKYCIDCASLAATELSGVLRKFTRDVAYYNIKTFSVEYVAEIRVGTKLEILCWEDQIKPSILFFLVKNGEKITNRCIGEWYAKSDGSLVELSKKVIPDSYSKM